MATVPSQRAQKEAIFGCKSFDSTWLLVYNRSQSVDVNGRWILHPLESMESLAGNMPKHSMLLRKLGQQSPLCSWKVFCLAQASWL